MNDDKQKYLNNIVPIHLLKNYLQHYNFLRKYYKKNIK